MLAASVLSLSRWRPPANDPNDAEEPERSRLKMMPDKLAARLLLPPDPSPGDPFPPERGEPGEP